MTPGRFENLDREGTGLTDQGLIEGYHFCPDWDGALVGPLVPSMMMHCTCRSEKSSAFHMTDCDQQDTASMITSGENVLGFSKKLGDVFESAYRARLANLLGEEESAKEEAEMREKAEQNIKDFWDR